MPPVTVMFKPVSGACNMRCHYCFYADEMTHRSEQIHPPMTDELLETVVRRTMAYADGSAQFVFQGGEPTLIGLGFFERLLKYERAYNPRGISVANSVQTNAFALSDEMIAFFAEHGFLLGVSLDGAKYTHDALRKDNAGAGSYETVRANIRRLEAAKVPFNILCVVNGLVAEHAQEALAALAAFPYLQFIPCLDGLDGETTAHSLTAEGYAAFLEHAFQMYCAAYRRGKPISMRTFDNWLGLLMGLPPENCAMRGQCDTGFVVESNGDVFPCDFYAVDEWKLGNVQHKSFRQMARSERMQAFHAASLPVPEKCRACAWYDLCRNGCRRERDARTGLYRFCEVNRAFLDEHTDEMRRMAQEIARR